MSITPESLAALGKARLALDELVDPATAELATAWSAAWAELTGEWQAAITELLTLGDGQWPSRRQVLRAARARAALEQAAASIRGLSSLAAVRISRDLTQIVAAAGQWQETITRTQLPDAYTLQWSRVSDKALDAIVARTTQRVHKLTRPLPRWVDARMKAALVRGVAVGDNPKTVARLIIARCGDAFTGGLTRATTIARTEMLDAHRAAALASRTANADVVAGWTWITALDSRTCPACLAMHGTEHGADESGPDGHQCCRCAAAPRTKTWRDLGIDIDEPPSVLPDAQEWFDAQPQAVQVGIMGPGRLSAYRSGDLAWSDMAVKRSNDGWRDSWVTAPLGRAA